MKHKAAPSMFCNKLRLSLLPTAKLHYVGGGGWQPQRLVHVKRSTLYRNCFRILGVEESSDQNTVRRAYIELVKKVHPDSGRPEASAERFQQVDEAFKMLQEKFAKNRRGIEDEVEEEEAQEFDIRHTAPQHRQYLNFDGVGIGNPFQRQKQYQQVKVYKAQERILNHRVDKAQAGHADLLRKGGTYYRDHAIKTKYGIDRVVEDLIQESMSKGDFNNLTGTGKPLSSAQTQNPYLDFTTHKLNKIMLDNGFTPEWITLQRDIRSAVKMLKEALRKERTYFGEQPFSDGEAQEWQHVLSKYADDVKSINRNIDKYNLIVPILKNQYFRLNLNSLADNILKDPSLTKNLKRTSVKVERTAEQADNRPNFLSFFGAFF